MLMFDPSPGLGPQQSCRVCVRRVWARGELDVEVVEVVEQEVRGGWTTVNIKVNRGALSIFSAAVTQEWRGERRESLAERWAAEGSR